jgi:hypothetical protein
LSADELSHELTFLDRLKDLYDARKTAVHAEAELRLQNGEFVPGWGLKDRFGNRKFNTDMTTVELVTGVSPYKTVDVSPVELERAGADKKIVKALTYTPKIGHKLDRVTGRDFGRMFRDRG